MDFFDIMLPLAGIQVNIIALLIIGVLTGILTGMFGLGGGFIVIPFLSMYNLPVSIAVATSANQMIAGAMCSFVANYRLKKVDFKLGAILIASGIIGTAVGAVILHYLNQMDNGNAIITLCFLVLLVILSVTTLHGAFHAVFSKSEEETSSMLSRYMGRLPFKIVLPAFSKPTSVIPILVLGVIAGSMVVLLGLGGGFIMLPVLLYTMKCDKAYLGGSLQMQILVTSIISTFIHSITFSNIDIVLSSIVVIGTVFGARIGVMLSHSLSSKSYKVILSIVLITIAFSMFYKKLSEPDVKIEATLVN